VSVFQKGTISDDILKLHIQISAKRILRNSKTKSSFSSSDSKSPTKHF